MNLIKQTSKNLTRKRFKKLQPVVGITENSVKLVYGRFSYYYKDNDLYVIIDHSGCLLNCFMIKKITEDQLIRFVEAEK